MMAFAAVLPGARVDNPVDNPRAGSSALLRQLDGACRSFPELRAQLTTHAPGGRTGSRARQGATTTMPVST
jgi:hypothetical protein